MRPTDQVVAFDLWNRRGAAALVLALAAFVQIAPAAYATFPGRNGRIAFARLSLDGTAPSQIFTIKQDGAHLRKLTKGAGDKFSPAYSADGKRIAFSRSTTGTPRSINVVVMNARGDHLRQLTHAKAEDWDPQFGPDGRTIVFARRGKVSGIYSIRADGSHARLLVRDADQPAYSPDGRTIVYASFATGKHGLFVMHSDGTHRRQLTRDPLSSPDPGGNRSFLHVDGTPSFAPDGHRVVFMRRRTGCAEGGDIYVMKIDGTHLHAVTHDGSRCAPWSAPAFSPGGKRIVVSGLSHLDVMHADGSHRRILRAGRHQYFAPDWQPLPFD
jgi:TolB protein